MLLFASGVLILVLALVATDGRVRERASILLDSGRPAAGLTAAGAEVADRVSGAVGVTRSWSRDHSVLTVFAVVALVLVTAVWRIGSWH